MAEAQAGQQAEAQQENEEQQEGQEQEGQGEQRQAERTYTQAELDRILGKVRKNARYLGRKEAEAELVRQGASPRQAEQAVDRQQEQQPKAAPKREDFENYEDFLMAKADHAARQASREERESSEKEAREKRVAEERTKTQSEFKKRAAALMKVNPGWAEKIESAENVMISPTMGEAIQESEQGPQVLEYLVDNPDEADRISQLPSKAQLREIGKLEARIEAEIKAKTKAKPQGEEGDEEDQEGEEREDESAEAEGKGKGKDEDRDADGRFKAQEKGSRKAPDPIEPGTGRSANQDRGPTDKDSDTGWYAKRLAMEKAERARQHGK